MRGGIVLSILAAIAVVTWFVRGDRDDLGSGALAPTPVGRGYYMLNAHIFGTDESGELLYELAADRALQEASRDPIELSGIRVDYEGGEGRWQIEAATATLQYGGERIALSGNVVARRRADDTVGPVTVRTETLAFDPVQRSVETEATVRFEIGEGSLVATGMRALLDEDRIELRSNIRGQFTP
jgi:lipopolysaccharide export system protein LptC